VGPADHSVGLRGGVGSTFSQEQCICPTLLMTHERLQRMGDRPHEVYAGRTCTSVGSVHVVLVGFSPAGCTSIQITATLGYE
jgi:hypothetical protein